MSKPTIDKIRSLGDFQPNHNWNIHVPDGANIWSTDMSQDLNVRCESIDTEVNKEVTKHKMVFVETVDGRAYNLLKSLIRTDAIVKISLVDRQDVEYMADTIPIARSKCKISRHLDNGSASDILRLTLEIETPS